MCETGTQRLLSGFDDVCGCVEIGFADLEMDHVFALCFQSACLNEDIKGGFCSQL